MISSGASHRRTGHGGFSLIEVMAAVMLLGVSMVVMLELRNAALSRAADARSLSVASRLGLGLLHQIEGARVIDLYDGYNGDFADQGFPEFIFTVGVGDDSAMAGGAVKDENELIWRKQKQELLLEEEEDEEDKPPFTRIFVDVNYPGSRGARKSFFIETLLPTWAVEQDFEMWEEQWGANSPDELE